VSRFLNSKRNQNLADSTLDKLTTIFEKQFLAWATSWGFVHINEITTADLEGFREVQLFAQGNDCVQVAYFDVGEHGSKLRSEVR
jgi:hypothetical protein